MKKLLNTLILATALTLNINAISFVDFNVFDIYAPADFRSQSGTAPFPIIFHYNKGGLSSCWDEIRINAQTPTNIPENVQNFIKQQNLQNVQYFEAYCKITQNDCNYFTHTWSMDKMTVNLTTYVSTGMFEAHNLVPINGEIGTNTLVTQTMSYHDSVYLSGDVARFKILDINQLADAWFISVYDPQPNDKKQQKVIVVHWYFFNEKAQQQILENSEQSPILHEALTSWGSAQTVIVVPQITPVK